MKHIGYRGLTGIVLCSILGPVILIIPSKTKILQIPPSLFALVILPTVFLSTLLLTICYSELLAKFPENGGEGFYYKKLFPGRTGEILSALFSFLSYFIVLPMSTAAVLRIFADATGLSTAASYIFVLITVHTFLFINLAEGQFPGLPKNIQGVLTILKVVVNLILIGLAFSVVFKTSAEASKHLKEFFNFRDLKQVKLNNLFQMINLVIFCFEGWNTANFIGATIVPGMETYYFAPLTSIATVFLLIILIFFSFINSDQNVGNNQSVESIFMTYLSQLNINNETSSKISLIFTFLISIGSTNGTFIVANGLSEILMKKAKETFWYKAALLYFYAISTFLFCMVRDPGKLIAGFEIPAYIFYSITLIGILRMKINDKTASKGINKWWVVVAIGYTVNIIIMNIVLIYIK